MKILLGMILAVVSLGPIFADSVTIGIVGGEGKMGTLFRTVFSPYAGKILCSSSDEETRAIVGECDVIIVSVPIRDTERVIHDIAPRLREDQLLMDLTSLKTKPCLEMLSSKASVIGMHPLFGPAAGSLKEQNIVLSPERPGKWKEWLMPILEEEGAKLLEMCPEDHDRWMAQMQALVHFTAMVVADTMRLQGFVRNEMSTPTCKMQLAVIERIFSQNADLYADIQIENPIFPQILASFRESFEKLDRIVKAEEKDAFREFFEENAAAYH